MNRPWRAALGLLALAATAVPAAQGDWPVYGGSSTERHYSPLSQIDTRSVSRLKPAWSAVLDVPRSNAEPIAV
ncbi:MAG: hypothetical protein RL026_568, partial [Pseudomonadota bacterium]